MAQGITIAFSPVITRLYGPEAFGMLGTFMALVAVVTPIAALTYPVAIVLPKNDSEASGIARLSMLISFYIAAFFLFLILIGGSWLVEILQVGEIKYFILLIPLVMVFAAWLQVNQQWLIRKQIFKVKSKVAVLHSLVVNGVKSGVGLYAPLGTVLIAIAAAGKGFHAFMLNVGLKKSTGNYNFKASSSDNLSLIYLAKKHKDFPFYRAPLQFVNNIAVSIPVLILSIFFGPAQAGFFVLCKNILNKPADLIGRSVADVFYPHVTQKANDQKEIYPSVLKATISLSFLGIVVFTPFVIWGPTIFGFIFGSEWTSAGEYARWVSIWMFFVLTDKPSIRALPVLSAQKFLLVITLLARFTGILLMIVSYYLFKNDIIIVATVCLTTALFTLLLIVITLKKSKNFDIINLSIRT